MQTNGKTAGIDYNVQVIRVISFVMVVAIHVTNYYCRAFGSISDGEYIFALITDTLSRVSVPCFFMISGAFLLGMMDTSAVYIRRLGRFALALAVWSAVYCIWNYAVFGETYSLKKFLYLPAEAHLWYLYAMIPIYLVMPFFQILCAHLGEKWEKVFLMVITAAVVFNYLISLIGVQAYYDVPLVGDRVYAFYVFAGYYLYKYRDRIKIGKRMIAAVFWVCAAACTGITWIVSDMEGVHYEKILQYGDPLIILMSVAFFLYFLKIRDGRISLGDRSRKAVDICCECSFGVYLIHILFLDTFKKYVAPEDLSAWIAIPLLIPAIVAVSLVCVRLLRLCSIGRKIT